MAKFLVLSLLRTRFDGDIVVFKNSPKPLFALPRPQVREVLVRTNRPRSERFGDYAQSWKFRVREHLHVAEYDKVLFLDADCLALRNINPLLNGDWDLAFYREHGSSVGMRLFNAFISDQEAEEMDCEGLSGGVVGVRAALYQKTMRDWERIHFGPGVRRKSFTDQAAWTRLVIQRGLKKRAVTQRAIHT